MSGLFGGLLSFIEIAGGCIVYVLVGGKAWNTSTDARIFRLIFGGIVTGLIVGTAIYLIMRGTVNTYDLGELQARCFFGVPLISLAVVGGLQFIKSNLD